MRDYRKSALSAHMEKIREEKIDKAIERWENNIPKKYRGFNLQNIVKNKWGGRLSIIDAKAISLYASQPEGFLILAGGEGRGKSTLAATVVTEYIAEHPVVKNFPIYASVPTLLNEFSRNFEDDTRSRVATCDILVLDDVGASSEGITAFQKKTLWSVISDRWSNELPTIMTTNMSFTSNEDGLGLLEWFGESAWARIRDKAVRIEFKGDSFRSS